MEHDCSLMYNRNNLVLVGMIQEFVEGVTRFANHTNIFDSFLTSGLIRCPCIHYEGMIYQKTKNVALHLMMDEFK